MYLNENDVQTRMKVRSTRGVSEERNKGLQVLPSHSTICRRYVERRGGATES